MPNNLISRIEGLLEKATKAGWDWDTYNTVFAGSESTKDLVEICTIPDDPETGESPKRSRDEWYPESAANAQLIAELRNAAPALMDALSAAKELCKVIENGHIRYVNETLEYEALRSKLAALEEL